MASTAEGTALTDLHRRQQLALRAATLRDLLTIWRAFSIDDIKGTWPQVETALVALIQARRAISAGLAATYYDRFRAAEQVDGSVVPLISRTPSAAEVALPLRIYGPAGAGRLLAAARTDAAAVTLTNLAGEVSRQTMNGGRETILNTVVRDGKGLGYLRVTAASPCAYCAMLSARGPIYVTQESALGSGSAKYHRSCGCTAEPVFDRDQPWPGRGREFEQTWKQAKARASESGDRIDVEFRRLIEGR